MTFDELRAGLEAKGWQISRNPMRGQYNEIDWYGYSRMTGVPDCDCNDKPPSLICEPSSFEVGGHRHNNVAFSLTGETSGRWFKLEAYSVRPDEAIDAIPDVRALLGRAWSALTPKEAP